MAYINEYSDLNSKERRQLAYKRKFKEEYPQWDDSMIVLRDEIAKRLPAQALILDAGCGHGNFVIDELRLSIARAVGLDVQPEVTAQNTSLDEIVFGHLEALPFQAETFDAVVSLWVLEHVLDSRRIFAELFRVLKPGGFFAFVTPNRKSGLIYLRRMMSQHLADRLVDALYGRKEDDIFPIRYQANSIAIISSLAREMGFEIEMVFENADPSYTSFNHFTYRLSAWVSKSSMSFFHPHIIGILRKPYSCI